MKLTTSLTVGKTGPLIDYESRLVSVGSCFAENMADKFKYFGFTNTANPFGILFSPTAIEKVLSFATEEKVFAEEDIFFHNERWSCFDVHSDLSAESKAMHLEQLNAASNTLRKSIRSASHLIITLGTAWVYRNTSGNLVANCHKIPQKQFSKELLTVEAVRQNLESIVSLVRTVNPAIEVIFTISPVRHIKDGFVENQRSKAHLVAALHDFLSGENAKSCHYFPAYEIMMDELRDYRFYATDMLHPNVTAIEYIWEKFSQAWIAEAVFPVMKEVENIRLSSSHRPFNSESAAHQFFLSRLEEQKTALLRHHPSIQL